MAREFSTLRHSPSIRMALSVGILACIGLGGCASVDLDAPKGVLYHLAETEDSVLTKFVTPREANLPKGYLGFSLKRDGPEAVAARIVLARNAEKPIDAQYYFITNDQVEKVFLGTLLEAADRGVRVRLIPDDIVAGWASDDAVRRS